MGLGFSGPILLSPLRKGVVAPAASWHRGGVNDRPGVGSGLDIHRSVRPMVEVERRSVQPFLDIGLALFSLVVQPRVAQDCPFPVDLGADGCAGAKALHEAHSGDVYERRLLPWGVVMALPMLSLLECGGNPWFGSPDQTAATPWCRPLLGCVVLVARGVPGTARWNAVWRPLWAWACGAQWTLLAALLCRHLLVDGPIPLLTHRLLVSLGWAVCWLCHHGGRVGSEDTSFDRDAVRDLGVLHLHHSWKETIQWESSLFGWVAL
jgi:hypothetical protein